MRADLLRFWESRAPRERQVLAVVVVIAAVAAYAWFAASATQSRDKLAASVLALRSQAAALDRDANEYERIRALQPQPASQTDLRTLLQTLAGSAGLAGALTQVETRDFNEVRATFGAISFAEWISWVDSLKSQQVRPDACRIEALSMAGMVSVTATFARPKPQ